MYFTKKLKVIFLSITLIAVVLLVINIYTTYKFDNSPLPQNMLNKLAIKEQQLKQLIIQKYRIQLDIPIIISNEIPKRYYGLATIDTNKEIKIILNKDAFRDSSSYMIEDVLPHEYAHAIMFYFGDYSKTNGGHTQKWREVCKALNGKMCNRYVDRDEVIREKLFN